MKIEAEEIAEKGVLELREFENGKRAGRRGNAAELPESRRIVCQIAKPERRSHQIECAIGKRKRQRVRFHKFEAAMTSGGGLFARAQEHRFREIGADERGKFVTRGSHRGVRQSQAKVSCPAANVENACAGAREDRRKTAGQAFAPNHVETQRKGGIKQVVTRRQRR